MSDNWRLTLPCTRHEAEAIYNADDLLTALNPQPTVVTQESEAYNDSKWEMLAYFDGRPPPQVIAAIRELVPGAIDVEPVLEKLPDEDWLTMSQQALKPVHAGRFYVHTSDNIGRVPTGTVQLLIEAGQAFGTGGHETTSGCLAMLDTLKRNGRRFDLIADIGTGTGLLAFAALHLWPRAYVTASDIDPISIDVTAENAAANQLILGQHPGELALCVASGTDHEMIQRRAPYDLVIANILAGPLIELAPSLSVIISGGGTLILAGLLNTQASSVITAYRALGFRLDGRTDAGDWPCLRFVKRRKYSWQRAVRADGRTSQPLGDFGTW